MKLLANTVYASEELRDEIFCQLIKQTRCNPSAENSIKGWQLLVICSGTYPPNKTLERYLMSYCDENTRFNLLDGYHCPSRCQAICSIYHDAFEEIHGSWSKKGGTNCYGNSSSKGVFHPSTTKV